MIRDRRTIKSELDGASRRHGRYDHSLFPCFSQEQVATALKDTPVVMITGPRQCGKTTLVRDVVEGNREFITTA
jgi:predicted AAA+ superfamily ATPase